VGDDVVIGRWDRIDERDFGIVLVDYKSSEIDDAEKAESRAKESLKDGQLGLYALAYFEARQVDARGRGAAVHRHGQVGSAAVKDEHLERARERVREAAAGIREARYPAKARPSAIAVTARTACSASTARPSARERRPTPRCCAMPRASSRARRVASCSRVTVACTRPRKKAASTSSPSTTPLRALLLSLIRKRFRSTRSWRRNRACMPARQLDPRGRPHGRERSAPPGRRRGHPPPETRWLCDPLDGTHELRAQLSVFLL